MRSMKPEHLPEEQRKILRGGANLSEDKAGGKAREWGGRCGDRGISAAEPFATGDGLAVSAEVNRMIVAAINVDPRWFWEGPDA